MPDAPARRGPIFIVGAMGSGTTLLRLMLDSHPHIALPPETGFMRAYNAHRFIPFKWTGRGWANRLGWSDAELDRELAAFYDHLFQRYVIEHGKQRWGEKTPLHTWHVDDMKRLYPDAQFIGMIRHPGGSIASNATRFKDGFGRFLIHYDRYAREVVRQAARHPRRFVLVRYEDLVLQPEETMRELLRWLGEPWSDLVLEHHVVQGRRGTKKVVEGRTHVEDPIDVSRISKWTKTLNEYERRRMRETVSRLSAFLGYDVDDPSVLERYGDRGKLLVNGWEVRRRIKRFPDLDLMTKGQVPRNDRLLTPYKLALVDAVRGRPVLEYRPTLWRRARYAAFRRLPPGVRDKLRRAQGRY